MKLNEEETETMEADDNEMSDDDFNQAINAK
jgi:hypothetical protein